MASLTALFSYDPFGGGGGGGWFLYLQRMWLGLTGGKQYFLCTIFFNRRKVNYTYSCNITLRHMQLHVVEVSGLRTCIIIYHIQTYISMMILLYGNVGLALVNE